MMSIKRYEPGAYGAMNESEDGKYYHKRDVDELLKLLFSTIKMMPEDSYYNESYLKKANDEAMIEWGVK